MDPSHIAREEYMGRDALNVIEGEHRQFESKVDVVRRYVEQIVTGEFLNIKKHVDLAPKVKESGVLDKLVLERELLRKKKIWTGRVSALFAGCLGTLSGMSMLHIIVMVSIQDVSDFVGFYAKFARNVNIIFLLLANLSFMLCLTMSFIYA